MTKNDNKNKNKNNSKSNSKNSEYEGYKPKTIKILKKFGAKTWSKIIIKNEIGVSQGIILPRNKFAEDGFVEIKMKNGYNIGVPIDENSNITVLDQISKMEVKYEQNVPEKNDKLPNVKLFGTGGTISSRLDYNTGAVNPSFESGELYAAIPELSMACNLQTEVSYKILSENMKPKYWLKLAKDIAKSINSGIDGIIVAHGTDTMSFTSAALSFLLKNLRVPVILTGSQRSSDRPSSDSAINLLNAVKVAGNANLAEVAVCMLGTSDHDYGFLHRGTRVRKMHSSVRHAFRTIDSKPMGMIRGDNIKFFTSDIRHRQKKDVQTIAAKNIEDKIALIYSYPNMPEDLLDYYIDKNYKGIVLAGTGLGHVPKELYSSIERATEEKIPVVMTSQTIWGYTGMNVYETGRVLMHLGVIPGKNMLPEVAFAKLSWLLGNYDDPKEIRDLISTNISGEITQREPMDGYQILQGVESNIKPWQYTNRKK